MFCSQREFNSVCTRYINVIKETYWLSFLELVHFVFSLVTWYRHWRHATHFTTATILSRAYPYAGFTAGLLRGDRERLVSGCVCSTQRGGKIKQASGSVWTLDRRTVWGQ